MHTFIKHIILLPFLVGSLPRLFAAGFAFDRDQSLKWSGYDAVSGDDCSVTLRTGTTGLVIELLFNGTFKGFSMANPRDMTPTGSGFAGVADLFHGMDYTSFTYEPHIFCDGVTIASSRIAIGVAKRKAMLYGKTLRSLTRVVYQDHSPFMRIEGECRDLIPL